MNPRKIKKVLITGIAGSGGSYMAEYLCHHEPEVEVHGIYRRRNHPEISNLEAVKDRVCLHDCDLMDAQKVLEVVADVRPEGIFHLASNADVKFSFVEPQTVLANNILGTCHLFEAVRQAGIDPYLQHCSTSEVYGQVDPKNVPIKEDCPIQPASPYAVSKTAQDFLAQTYFQSYGMQIIRTRMFSYINPRRANLFAAAFARQVARIEAGLQTELVHGNLDSVRTLVDVNDAVEAYWLALQHGVPGEVYNIGGTTTITVGEFLGILKKHSRVPIPSRVDPQLLRPVDVTLQIPNADKFEALTGWKPKCSFDESVKHLLEYWRKQVQAEEKTR